MGGTSCWGCRCVALFVGGCRWVALVVGEVGCCGQVMEGRLMQA